MENIILIIILYFIGSIVSDNAKKKQRRHNKGNAENLPPDFEIPEVKRDNPFDFDIPPLDRENPLDFEIPRIEGAPKRKPEAGPDGVYREEEPEEKLKKTSISNKYLNYLNNNNVKHDIIEEKKEIPLKTEQRSKSSMILTRETARAGIVLSEILGKPKAYKYLKH